MELGYISAEYIPDAPEWLNQTRRVMNPEDLFRRVDFTEFATKATSNDWEPTLVCAPPLPQNELAQNCWDLDTQVSMMGKMNQGCVMKYVCAAGFTPSINTTAYSMCLPMVMQEYSGD